MSLKFKKTKDISELETLELSHGGSKGRLFFQLRKKEFG